MDEEAELFAALDAIYPGSLADWWAVSQGGAVPTDYFAAVAFRTLRVIGRFRFLAVERGRRDYLRFLPRMAAQTRRALAARDDETLLRLLAERSELFA